MEPTNGTSPDTNRIVIADAKLSQECQFLKLLLSTGWATELGFAVSRITLLVLATTLST